MILGVSVSICCYDSIYNILYVLVISGRDFVHRSESFSVTIDVCEIETVLSLANIVPRLRVMYSTQSDFLLVFYFYWNREVSCELSNLLSGNRCIELLLSISTVNSFAIIITICADSPPTS